MLEINASLDGYYVAFKAIAFLSILFMLIKMKFFLINHYVLWDANNEVLRKCNDYLNYDEIWRN